MRNSDSAVFSLRDTNPSIPTQTILKPAQTRVRSSAHRNDNKVVFVLNDADDQADLQQIRLHLSEAGIPDTDKKVLGIHTSSQEDLHRVDEALANRDISQIAFIARNGKRKDTTQRLRPLLNHLEDQDYDKDLFLAADGSFNNLFTTPSLTHESLKALPNSKVDSGLFQVFKRFFDNTFETIINNQDTISEMLRNASAKGVRSYSTKKVVRSKSSVDQTRTAVPIEASRFKELAHALHQPARTNDHNGQIKLEIEKFFPFIDKFFGLAA